mmetsp:Transcript_45334/g.95112  ORF Transcript_45334/g.95112 Transcript_45334/m.95112 type:complete len:134 (+) Transcript_45334:683-1084(+)
MDEIWFGKETGMQKVWYELNRNDMEMSMICACNAKTAFTFVHMSTKIPQLTSLRRLLITRQMLAEDTADTNPAFCDGSLSAFSRGIALRRGKEFRAMLTDVALKRGEVLAVARASDWDGQIEVATNGILERSG